MEDEIDLGKYVKVLTGRWKLIVGLAIVAGVAAFLVSSVIEPVYEATALVVATQPRYQLQFDPRIQTLAQTQQPFRAFPELALSDDLLLDVIDAMNGDALPNARDLTEFRSALNAEAGADPSLLRLSVSDTDAGRAQRLANTWASLYLEYASNLYRQQASNAAFFETQAAEADRALVVAEQALVDFQAQNPIVIVTEELSATQRALNGYLASDQDIDLTIQSVHSLQAQLAQQDVEASTTLADELAAMYLQVDALGLRSNVPIQLQIAGDGSIGSRTVSDQMHLLDALIEALRDKSTGIQTEIETLKPRILELQSARQQAQVELDRLTRDLTVAQNTYLTLVNKLEEAKVVAQDATGEIRLASLASVPMEPVSPRKGLNTVLGVVLGLVLGVVIALALGSRESGDIRLPVRAGSVAVER